MIFENFWPWAARSAISQSAAPWLDWLGVLGVLALSASYAAFYLLPRRHLPKLKVAVFFGALALLSQYHIERKGLYVELLMMCYIFLSIFPQKLLLKPAHWVRSFIAKLGF